VRDATACFQGCAAKVAAERDRADGLVEAAKVGGRAALKACDESCALRLEDLARPEPFPWGRMAGAGVGGVLLGAVAGVLVAQAL
jgi:hypothetical protein